MINPDRDSSFKDGSLGRLPHKAVDNRISLDPCPSRRVSISHPLESQGQVRSYERGFVAQRGTDLSTPSHMLQPVDNVLSIPSFSSLMRIVILEKHSAAGLMIHLVSIRRQEPMSLSPSITDRFFEEAEA